MRVVLACLLLVLSLPVGLAAAGQDYANARFGYAVTVPAGFAATGPEADNGDGMTFRNGAGTQSLSVWGGHVVEADFDAHALAAIADAGAAGWRVTYQAVTPGWASYSGLRNGHVLYGRQIALCGGNSYAAFAVTYPERDIARMNAVVDGLVASLRPVAGGAC